MDGRAGLVADLGRKKASAFDVTADVAHQDLARMLVCVDTLVEEAATKSTRYRGQELLVVDISCFGGDKQRVLFKEVDALKAAEDGLASMVGAQSVIAQE